MKDPELVVVVKNGMIRSAVKHVLSAVHYTEPIDYKEGLVECLNGQCQPLFLVIDAREIPTPVTYTLERLTQKLPDAGILAFNAGILDSSAKLYIHQFIEADDNESVIVDKFQEFLSPNTVRNNLPGTDNTLSEREKEVVKFVALGKTNKEISDELHISPHTVITHRKNITSKLGIKTIAGLAVYAVLNGLINPEEVNR